MIKVGTTITTSKYYFKLNLTENKSSEISATRFIHLMRTNQGEFYNLVKEVIFGIFFFGKNSLNASLNKLKSSFCHLPHPSRLNK